MSRSDAPLQSVRHLWKKMNGIPQPLLYFLPQSRKEEIKKEWISEEHWHLHSLTVGAPKQKWTAEEEAALKAGIAKHGAGKWRTILRDPEFSSILSLHSNVDLKDKWRNMSVTAHGWGSREKAR
ncbi:hypothetical protein NE237_020576 [Protea cynaroides]|uniref:Uncharacterized protein n=1 Tax=Protea cynaroides TaxID=273540 RepID=A0A9Q0H678_9MAGN|nr:hypothetical protein NE237_020576 [Protea cynaroides]